MNDRVSEQLDALLAPYNRSNEPGCTVSIARAGRTIFRRAYGMASLEMGVVNIPSTQMSVGSIAKQFTCAAIMLLEADNRLSRHDPVGRWLPEIPAGQGVPTLLQLMRHQGGVRCYLDQWMFDGYRTMPAGRGWDIQRRQHGLNFEPGSRSMYSNGGYILLSKVIERASGIAFDEFVRCRLLEPAGMRNSLFPARRTGAIPGLATNYMSARPGTGWTVAPTMTEDALGDGGLIATADDLLRWARFLRDGDGAISLAALQAVDEPWAPGPSDYRLGLIFQQWRGVMLAQHGGGLPGANSAFLMLPGEGLDLAILFNRAAPATSLALQALDLILGQALRPSPRPPAVVNYMDLIGSYFAADIGLVFGIRDDQGRLALTLFGDGPIPLETYPADDPELPFWADVGAAQMRFRRGTSPGRIDVFDGKAWSGAERIDDPAPGAKAISAGGGEFYSAEAAATLAISSQDGALTVHIRGETGSGDYQAEAIAPDLIRFWPALFPAGKLARLIRRGGVVDAIIVSTSRTCGITFRADGQRANRGAL